MKTSTLLFFLLCLLTVSNSTAQDSSYLSKDSTSKTFFLKHNPLSVAEFNLYVLDKRLANTYPSYVQYYVSNASVYKLIAPAMGQNIEKRMRLKMEWIFYCFAVLFLLLGFIRYGWKDYFDKIFLVYFNQGFILRQKKDIMMLWNMPSFLLNALFILSSGFFLFFGLGINYILVGADRWQVMIFLVLVILLVYLFKYFFLQLLGWMFKQRDAFEQYSFIVFLNNKIIGILMLVSSFVMAFSSNSSYQSIFKFVLYIIGILFVVRLINAFRIFTRQVRAGIFNVLMAFISLELLPTAMLFKFIFNGIFLLTGGLL